MENLFPDKLWRVYGKHSFLSVQPSEILMKAQPETFFGASIFLEVIKRRKINKMIIKSKIHGNLGKNSLENIVAQLPGYIL